MKVALLVDELPVSSAPKIVGEEAYHLNKLGVKCDVFVLKHREDEVPPAHAGEINVIHLDKNLGPISKICEWRVPTFSFFSLYHVIYPYVLTNKASKILDSYDAVIVHFSSTAIFASKLKLRNAHVGFYCHDPISYIFGEAYKETWSKIKRKILSQLATLIDKKLLEKFDITILQSKFHLKKIFGLIRFEKPIKVVYPGVNAVKSIPTERGDYILAVSRWERGKNPNMLIELAKQLKKELNDFKVLMVGPWKDSNLLMEFLKQIKNENVLKNFKILHEVKEQELQSLYLNARCLVHTRIEAFGFTGLEAASCGCPIVFPKGSGVTELFTHGVHGYFPEEGDVEAYAEYITKLMSDERLAYRMGYEAWKVAKKYTWKAHAEELLKVLL